MRSPPWGALATLHTSQVSTHAGVYVNKGSRHSRVAMCTPDTVPRQLQAGDIGMCAIWDNWWKVCVCQLLPPVNTCTLGTCRLPGFVCSTQEPGRGTAGVCAHPQSQGSHVSSPPGASVFPSDVGITAGPGSSAGEDSKTERNQGCQERSKMWCGWNTDPQQEGRWGLKL